MFKQIEDIQLSTFDAGVPWTWETYPEYLDAIRPGLGINVAGLVGHSPLRTYVMGAAAQERAATDDEIAAMCAHPAGRHPRRRGRPVDLVRRHRRAHAPGAEPLRRRATRSSRSAAP